MPDAADAISETGLTALARGVRACQAEGLATGHAPEELARCLWSMVHGAVLLALDGANARKDAAWREAHRSVDIALALLSGAA